jgi:signal transduction histidine kinase
VREAVLPVLLLHGRGHPQLTWEVDDVRAVGRPRAIATALDNLLRNAAAHAPGAAVRVLARRRGGVAEIVVEDDGPGIPAAERELVRQPGVRGSGATCAGSGLGLSNVATAMADQHGQLHIDASASGGTRVTLALPLRAPAALAG